jgi:hypothetical protein
MSLLYLLLPACLPAFSDTTWHESNNHSSLNQSNPIQSSIATQLLLLQYRYNYLSSHGTGAEAPDFDDAENHAAMMQAFVDMGFNPDEIQEIVKCVCAVLYLGNVSFKDEADGEASSVAGGASLGAAESAAQLISVEQEELSMALTTKAMATGTCYVILLFFLLFLFVASLSLSYPSITACLYSLTPHGTSLTITIPPSSSSSSL